MQFGCYLEFHWTRWFQTKVLAWALALATGSLSVGWSQGRANGTTGKLISDQSATGAEFAQRKAMGASSSSTKNLPKTAAGEGRASASVGNSQGIGATSSQLLKGYDEPPKLLPLNKIDVRQASSNKLNSTLPAAARSEGRESDYSPGSPYAMNGRIQAIPVAHNPGDQPDSNRPSITKSMVGDGSMAGDRPNLSPIRQVGGDSSAVQDIRPQVTRRPLPRREELSTDSRNVAKHDLADPRLPEIPAMPLDPPSLPDTSALPSPSTFNDPVPLPSQISLPSQSASGFSPPLSVEASVTQNVDSTHPPHADQTTNRLPTLQSGDSMVIPRDPVISSIQQSEAVNERSPLDSSGGTGRNAVSQPTSSLRDSNRMSMRSPQIQVSMDGPLQVAIGMPQAYQVIVNNVDRQILEGLVLGLAVPAGVKVSPKSPTHGQCQIESPGDGVKLLTWSFEQLEQNGQAILPLELTAEDSTDFSVAVEWTLQPMSAVAALQVLSPRLDLKLEGSRDVIYGQPNTYRLNIKNPGTADARNVTIKLTAQQYGSSSAVIDRIAAGCEECMDVELIFNQPGSIRVAAEAVASGNLSSISEFQVQVRQAQLELHWDAPEVAYYGTAVPYVLRLKNSGDASAEAVRTVIQIPADAKLESLPTSTTMENGALVWELPQLDPGSVADLNIQIAFNREGENQLAARCSQSSGNPVHGDTRTLIQAITDLKLVLRDPMAPAMVGGEVAYELELVNRGSKVAEAVNVIALFSKDIEPVRAEGHASQIFPGQVRFDTIAQIRPGETVQLKVYAIAELSGMHRFRAEVHTANVEIKLVQEETTQFIEAIRRTANSGASTVR